MENFIRAGRAFYGIGLAGIGVQHFLYSDFRPMILPYWPSSIPGLSIGAYLMGALLVVTGLLITFSNKARTIAIGLGILFFLLFFFHAYYQLFLGPYSFHLGLWTNALKELAFSGGAFIVAASFADETSFADNNQLLTIGRIFFAIMLIAFGIDHFLYTEFVETLVPDWIPGNRFWTYFGAVALIGSGLCILLKIKVRLVSLLLGIMLLLWFFILHIPRAIKNPGLEKGNEITSVFQALAFSGIAFIATALFSNRKSD